MLEGQNYTSITTLTSPYVVNLSGISLIYIDLPNVSTSNISSKNNGGFTTIVKSIVQDVPYGGILSYVNNTNSAVIVADKYISFFRVRLLDDDYKLLDLNGQNFTLTLELFYYFNGKDEASTELYSIDEIAKQQDDFKKSLLDRDES